MVRAFEAISGTFLRISAGDALAGFKPETKDSVGGADLSGKDIFVADDSFFFLEGSGGGRD